MRAPPEESLSKPALAHMLMSESGIDDRTGLTVNAVTPG